MNILVTGANGQLGREMRLVADSQTANRYIFTDVVESEGVETILLDMTDAQAVNRIVDAENVQAIVNCADRKSVV